MCSLLICIFILFIYLVWIKSAVNFLKSGTLQFWTWFCCLRQIFGIITDFFRCRAHFDFLVWHAPWRPNNCHWDESYPLMNFWQCQKLWVTVLTCVCPGTAISTNSLFFPASCLQTFAFSARQNIANITSRACLGLCGTISILAILERDTTNRLVNAVILPWL